MNSPSETKELSNKFQTFFSSLPEQHSTTLPFRVNMYRQKSGNDNTYDCEFPEDCSFFIEQSFRASVAPINKNKDLDRRWVRAKVIHLDSGKFIEVENPYINKEIEQKVINHIDTTEIEKFSNTQVRVKFLERKEN
jgi:hypothetical protein